MFTCWVVIRHRLDDQSDVVAVYTSFGAAEHYVNTHPIPSYYTTEHYEIEERELRD